MFLNNLLLSSLWSADFRLLEPHLTQVSLPLRQRLEVPLTPITHVYFPEAGLLSTVAHVRGLGQIGIGIIGYEGTSGIATIMSDSQTAMSITVQMAGHGSRIEVGYLRDAMSGSENLRTHLLRFARAWTMKLVNTALANGLATVDERLARWILMAHDRWESDRLPITHEFIAGFLGVRRAGVSTALRKLEEAGLISTARGSIVVQNRPALETVANGFYGVAEVEYTRLIGWNPSKRPKRA